MHFDFVKELLVSVGAYITIYFVDPVGAQAITKFFMDHSLVIAIAVMGYSIIKLLIERYFKLQELKVKMSSKDKQLS